MITKQEMMDFSKEFSLSPNIVEKDYVLGWLLTGIASDASLNNQWIFKGGTCLKKCYFETFRFSEDLDFTLRDESYLDQQFLKNCFNQIAHWIYENSGIEIPLDSIHFDHYKNKNGRISVEGRIGYIGPLKRRNGPARIKLDLSADEILVLPPVLREIHHPYSDYSQIKFQVNCYSFSEIFAEKIRALSERSRPRDLYDVVHLYRRCQFDAKSLSILEVLKKKCDFKKIPIPTIEYLENHPKRHELEAEWDNMLSHQLPVLPLMESFWQELPTLFNWLHGKNEKLMLETILLPNEIIDSAWKPSSMIQVWHAQVPLELVRYAGANHLCVELFYEGLTCLIEPYDLKRTRDGNLLLITIEHDTGKQQCYWVDKIQQIKVVQKTFKPRNLITLTSPALIHQ